MLTKGLGEWFGTTHPCFLFSSFLPLLKLLKKKKCHFHKVCIISILFITPKTYEMKEKKRKNKDEPFCSEDVYVIY